MYKISKEEFIERYNKTSVTKLAEELGVCRMTVLNRARKYNLPYKKAGGCKPKKSVIVSKEELKRLYNTMRTSDLANFFGVSIVTLLRIVKEQGIELKKVGHGVRQRKVVVEG